MRIQRSDRLIHQPRGPTREPEAGVGTHTRLPRSDGGRRKRAPRWTRPGRLSLHHELLSLATHPPTRRCLLLLAARPMAALMLGPGLPH